MIIRLSDDAERDLVDGIAFYNQHGRDVATYFLDSLMDDLRSLSVVGGVHGKRYGYHCMGAKRFPFAIYHIVEGSAILVLAILDERRDPEWIARRLQRG